MFSCFVHLVFQSSRSDSAYLWAGKSFRLKSQEESGNGERFAVIWLGPLWRFLSRGIRQNMAICDYLAGSLDY